jgi:hypothetical protein
MSVKAPNTSDYKVYLSVEEKEHKYVIFRKGNSKYEIRHGLFSDYRIDNMSLNSFIDGIVKSKFSNKKNEYSPIVIDKDIPKKEAKALADFLLSLFTLGGQELGFYSHSAKGSSNEAVSASIDPEDL